MNSPREGTGSETVVVPSARRVRGMALLFAVLAAGFLSGVATERARRREPVVRTKIVLKLQDVLDSLGLTADQRRQVEAVFERGRPRTEALMREMTPRLRAIADSADAELRRILTPSQRERLDAMRTSTPTLILKRKMIGAESLSRTETLTTTGPPRP